MLVMERAMGIEPTSEAWEASILPLYDARSLPERSDYIQLGPVGYRCAPIEMAKAKAKARAKALTGERNLMLRVVAEHKLGPCPALD
jgi:hypothetical protein